MPIERETEEMHVLNMEALASELSPANFSRIRGVLTEGKLVSRRGWWLVSLATVDTIRQMVGPDEWARYLVAYQQIVADVPAFPYFVVKGGKR